MSHVLELERPTPASARRVRPPRWVDARLIVGLVLVAVAVIATVRLLEQAGRTVEVYAAVDDLAAGVRPTTDDLRAVPVRLTPDTAARYLAVDAATVEFGVLQRDVAAGELVPAAALGSASEGDSRLVPVPLDADRARALARGDAVDVYATPRAGNADAGPTVRLLQQAVVHTVDRGDTRFGGGAASVSVVLSVPAESVAALVAGARRGDIDLVAANPA